MTHDVHRWFRDLSLPRWIEVGWDSKRNIFVEQLDLNGRPCLEVPLRTMVQCRQIYVMAVAARRGWHPLAKERGLRAAETLFSRFATADAEGGFVFAVDRRLEVLDARHDLYAHAFVLLACAALTGLTSDGAYLDRADRTLRFLDARLSTLLGGHHSEGILPRRGPRHQNPYMHLLEALLALHECDPTRRYLERAEAICRLLEQHFIRRPANVLTEHFEADWRPIGDSDCLFEPGHHFEWVWLLDQFRRLGGSNRTHIAECLWSTAVSYGIGQAFEVFDVASVSGNSTKRSTRLWPQTEAARAALVRPFDARAGLSDAIMDGIADRFLHRDDGLWTDRRDEIGNAASTVVPASSLYHLCAAIDAREKFAGSESVELPSPRADADAGELDSPWSRETRAWGPVRRDCVRHHLSEIEVRGR